MQKLITFHQQTLLKYSFILMLFLGQISCTKTQQSNNSSTQNNLIIPDLFQRTGDLAKADEWQKTQEKSIF